MLPISVNSGGIFPESGRLGKLGYCPFEVSQHIGLRNPKRCKRVRTNDASGKHAGCPIASDTGDFLPPANPLSNPVIIMRSIQPGKRKLRPRRTCFRLPPPAYPDLSPCARMRSAFDCIPTYSTLPPESPYGAPRSSSDDPLLRIVFFSLQTEQRAKRYALYGKMQFGHDQALPRRVGARKVDDAAFPFRIRKVKTRHTP